MSRSTAAALPAVTLDIAFDEDEKRDAGAIASLLQRAADTAWQAEGDGEPAAIAVALVSDAEICRLNAEFLGKDKVTDVLSFPADDDLFGADESFLGDIALALDFIGAEATLENKSFEDHLAHLFIHGILHLMGYDHIEPDAAREMEKREVAVLAGLGIADPYAGRALIETRLDTPPETGQNKAP